MDSYSYSAYSALKRCGKFFENRYILGLPEPGPLSCNLAFGTAIHAGLNSCLNGDDGTGVFELHWDSYADKSLQYDRFDHLQLRTIGISFCEKFSKRYAPKMKWVCGEERIYGEFNGIKIEGTPDAVVTWEGKLTLIDFKTTAYAYDKDKALCSLQLNLYALLLALAKNIVVDQIAYFPFVKTTGGIQTPIVEPFDQSKAQAMLLDMTNDLKRNSENYVKNTNACIQGKMRCSYFNKCWKNN